MKIYDLMNKYSHTRMYVNIYPYVWTYVHMDDFFLFLWKKLYFRMFHCILDFFKTFLIFNLFFDSE